MPKLDNYEYNSVGVIKMMMYCQQVPVIFPGYGTKHAIKMKMIGRRWRRLGW